VSELLALPAKNRLGRKEPRATNTLAYYDPKLIQGPHSLGELLAFPTKIKLGRKEPRATSTAAY
jgi:hypothetical protein